MDHQPSIILSPIKYGNSVSAIMGYTPHANIVASSSNKRCFGGQNGSTAGQPTYFGLKGYFVRDFSPVGFPSLDRPLFHGPDVTKTCGRQ